MKNDKNFSIETSSGWIRSNKNFLRKWIFLPLWPLFRILLTALVLWDPLCKIVSMLRGGCTFPSIRNWTKACWLGISFRWLSENVWLKLGLDFWASSIPSRNMTNMPMVPRIALRVFLTSPIVLSWDANWLTNIEPMVFMDACLLGTLWADEWSHDISLEKECWILYCSLQSFIPLRIVIHILLLPVTGGNALILPSHMRWMFFDVQCQISIVCFNINRYVWHIDKKPNNETLFSVETRAFSLGVQYQVRSLFLKLSSGVRNEKPSVVIRFTTDDDRYSLVWRFRFF